MHHGTTLFLLALLFGVAGAPSVSAQSLDLTVGGYGLSIGDSREVNGVRLNFRDRRLRQVNGINATIWTPPSPARGIINGIALGLPVTGGRRINGLATGLLGAGAEESIRGVLFAPLGAGAGERIEGIGLGGLGIGAGGDVIGIMAGGLGVGAGGHVTGLMIGGLGVGAGQDVTGIMIGGVGVGAGGDVTGLMIGGVGVGAGGTLTGLMIGGVGVGAAEVRGVMLSGVAAGGETVTGAVLAPAYFRITDGGAFTGVSMSAFNHIKGEQNGLTIGLLNYAWRLNGLQLGLLNYAGNKSRLRWLPFINWHFD